MENQLEIYKTHEGTVKVAGRTVPKDAAYCALRILRKGIEKIDFLYIGGNSGQQAMKAMSIMTYIVSKETPTVRVSFVPLRYLTETLDPSTQQTKMKDCTVWRVLVTQQT